MSYNDPAILFFAMVGLFGLWRLRSPQKRLACAIGILGLVLLSWPPVDWLLSQPLEMWYPIQPFPGGAAEAIVVLSSSVDPPKYERPYPLPDKYTSDRCEYAAWLYKNWKPLPVLACGGTGRLREPYSVVMSELLQREGVPRSMIWTEEHSHNTHDNARYGAEILREHGIGRVALVVEAQSMLRAAACFRKQGIAVVPAPSEFREWGPLSDEIMLGWKAVYRNEITVHEVGGLIWYRLRGWI